MRLISRNNFQVIQKFSKLHSVVHTQLKSNKQITITKKLSKYFVKSIDSWIHVVREKVDFTKIFFYKLNYGILLSCIHYLEKKFRENS